MPTQCSYCGDPVSDDEYERHLDRAHADELTAIDRRRVNLSSGGSKRRNLALYAGASLVLALFLVGYAAVFLAPGTAASSAAVQPDADREIHEHGTIDVQYDETVVAFDDPQYAELDECFHFHEYDNGDVWHTHCENVTIEYALETLGMTITAEEFAVNGQTFSERDGDTISVTVNGGPVDPQAYVLEGVESVDDAQAGVGDHVEIVVKSGD
ncbi:hypothetical protein GS429_07610 [Natronorubrum sp. JWXQ-INN-674]|uniref:C2H2-type domain-containing protein n=1 Tax=Natronorubrum halalkaliphilum TaxID=2691917 RepID=A0A6B0VL71_9EURY|nr:hypothetical protein [Natronorubrum halalkaliphilum]MXV61923.1 hypothetical protein [Natronorubrum halalkaliphilum]